MLCEGNISFVVVANKNNFIVGERNSRALEKGMTRAISPGVILQNRTDLPLLKVASQPISSSGYTV